MTRADIVGMVMADASLLPTVRGYSFGNRRHRLAAFGEPLNSDALWLGMGVTLLIQRLVMTGRARSGQIPVREGPLAAVNA